MEGQLIAAIVALLVVISTGGTGVVRYLLKQIEQRDARIDHLTATLNTSNDLNAKLAGMWVAQEQARGGKAP